MGGGPGRGSPRSVLAIAAQVDPQVQAARTEASAAPGDLALVPLAASDMAITIATSELGEKLKEVKRQVRAHRHVQRQTAAAAAEKLVEWNEKGGKAICMKVVDDMPSLAEDLSCLHARPMGASLQWVRVASPAAEMLPKVLAYLRSDLQRAVVDEAKGKWLARHVTLLHDEQDRVDEPAAPRGRHKPKPSCHAAGHCLCGDGGDALWALHQRVITSLRKAMKDGGTKKMLQEGHIVMNFTALNEEVVGGLEDGDIAASDRSTDVLDPDGFVHISILMESPLRPTFRLRAVERTS